GAAAKADGGIRISRGRRCDGHVRRQSENDHRARRADPHLGGQDMQEHLRAGPATGEVCPTLAEDLLRGADAIALFVFGDAKERRKVYYYASEAKVRMPTFRMGNVICARKSKLIGWIEQQEAAR